MSSSYTQGSVLKHITGLSLTSAVGLFAIFIVDLVDMFFISLLGEKSLAAAVGFAGLGLFLGASVCIGISVAISTVVSQAIGESESEAAQNPARVTEVLNPETLPNGETAQFDPDVEYGPKARRMATHGLLYSLFWTIPVTVLTWVYAPQLLGWIGADGDVLTLAVQYFRIVGATLPILGIAFACNSLLRSVGAGKMSMWTTLWGGIVNGILDPILIFTAGLGLSGAAIASVVSRFVVAGIGFYDIQRKRRLLSAPQWKFFFSDIKELNGIALPSMLTNLSAPISSAFATAQMARFGTDAVAAASVIGRISPVLFAGLYGLSGAVGPVASQNFGAKKLHRVHESLMAGARFVVIYVVPVAILMLFLNRWLATVFSLDAEAAELLSFFATFIVGSYALFGLQLTANPLFTVLRHPGYATVSNVGRDLILAIPLIYGFSALFGAKGVIAGQAVANSIAGIIAFATAHWLIGRVEAGKSIDIAWSKIHLHHHLHGASGVNHRGH